MKINKNEIPILKSIIPMKNKYIINRVAAIF